MYQNSQECLNLYANCMEEVKKRTNSIKSILMRESSTLYPITNTEFMALQLRKILELISLANLVANKEQYEEIRKEFYKDWNAKRIIKKIKIINPNYYPVGIQRIPQKDQYRWEDKTENILTEDLFIKAYDDMSCILHSKNPFSDSAIYLNDVNSNISVTLSLITNLLNEHIVRLSNGDILNCTMESHPIGFSENKRVSVCYFQKVSMKS